MNVFLHDSSLDTKSYVFRIDRIEQPILVCILTLDTVNIWQSTDGLLSYSPCSTFSIE